MGSGSPRLVLVGTPIGNLGDLSPRVAEAFAAADVVACEDTRRTGKLLAHLGVRAPKLLRLDEHTEFELCPEILSRISSGEVVAVASDAGMPGLSDPGARVAALAAEAGMQIEVIPGPFAAAVALVGSGLLKPSGRFCFEGFLPRKGPERAARLADLVGESRIMVLYEAPHRLERTLADLAQVLGKDRLVALCRELTKLHEETWRGNLEQAVQRCQEIVPRGEYVLVIDGSPPLPEATDELILSAIQAALGAGATRRDAAVSVAKQYGVAPNRVKRLLSSLEAPS
ncbi:MAG: 16S rRNA (cytidine(1402)-2'-O)-methyltransferase [Actinomycetes bacterium]